MKLAAVALVLILVLSAFHQGVWAAAIAAIAVVIWAFRHMFRSHRRAR
jgi:hypothetical protein